MSDLILYWVGALAVLVVLLVATALIGRLAYECAENACKDILRFRRLAWLRYWTGRLEREGLLPLDEHYRAISKAQRPADVDQAHEWEHEATKGQP